MCYRVAICLLISGCSSVAANIENSQLRITFTNSSAMIFARQERDWIEVAAWNPLWRFITDKDALWTPQDPRIHQDGKLAIDFLQTASDPNGIEWNVRLRIALEKSRPVARIQYQIEPKQAAAIKAFSGPMIHVGQDTTGAAKTWGLFPGLEYLFGAEPSSNERDFTPNLANRSGPHPNKITVPLMAITIGPESQKLPEKPDRFLTPDSLMDRAAAKSLTTPFKTNFTVALSWEPLSKWDGTHAFPTPQFRSPDKDTHFMALSLPSIPDFMAENSDRAKEPFQVAPGKPLSLKASLIVSPGPVLVAVHEWLADRGGLPKPNAPPRSFQQELGVCRAGFLKTVWDDKSERWRHCIGWATSHAPGFASLLWWDSKLAENADARRQSAARVELAATNMLRDGVGHFTSQANCHIMQWEFPFIYGHLSEAFAGVEGLIQHLIQTQNSEGGWEYKPDTKEQASLGRAGDSVLGTCANRAATILRYARITGDSAALAAGEKTLRFMEQFRVPRGGQTWECPMYEPDILAAAHAIHAYNEAYRATGNRRWLHNAVYWAETGVPFQYLWSLPDKPMMLGASIPVFGSTFYKHSWLAVPVQWCGLVYARQLWQLATELDHAKPSADGSPFVLALNFAPQDWRRMAELVTLSAMHQQFDSGERIGAYPDSISKFETRNPAFLNPEDIMVNVLAMSGHDPDINTARIQAARKPIVISSGARIGRAQANANTVRLDLSWFEGELSHSMISGLRPNTINLNGELLSESKLPLKRQPGWYFDSKQNRLFLTIQHTKEKMTLECR